MQSKVLYKKGNATLRYWINKSGLSQNDLVRALKISQPTIYKLINDPFLMTLQQLTTVAGMFGLTIEELVYCINRNKPKIKQKADSWYLSDIRDKGDKLFPEVKE